MFLPLLLLCGKIIFDIEGGDEKWLQTLHQVGFSESEIKDSYTEVCKSIENFFESNTVSTALAACMYQYTWASTEGLPNVMNTVSGSAAGTPLADLMYVVAMSKVMHKFRKDMEIENLTDMST